MVAALLKTAEKAGNGIRIGKPRSSSRGGTLGVPLPFESEGASGTNRVSNISFAQPLTSATSFPLESAARVYEVRENDGSVLGYNTHARIFNALEGRGWHEDDMMCVF